jgi:hypothetical protein
MAEKNKTVLRVGRLDTIGSVRSELGRLYRAARRGDLDCLDATRLAVLLKEIRATIESHDIERRLVALEEQSDDR